MKSLTEILIAEDSPTQAEQLAHLLQSHGYAVHVASNGALALAAARKRTPSLIISDVVMPDMDGFSLCKSIKSDEQLKDVPVVLVTELSSPQDVMKGLECGADNFLRKPYDEKYLLSRIQHVLANRELRSREKMQLGVELHFGGRHYFITSERQQILDLLLSTFEEAVRLNQELQAKRNELAAAYEQLEKHVAEVERISKFKDQFLSTMSHELRTPLNAVLGFSELLQDERYGRLNERQRRYLSHIQSGGQHLLRLIGDILDLSKIEAGRLELEIESVPVKQIFGEVVSALRPLADKKKQVLSLAVPEDLAVRADLLRFKQVLMNLLGNAIKFTPESGCIDLAARPRDGQVRVEVRDTGPGIRPEDQKRIFEAFVRLQQTGNAGEGTGLGLAITQRLVELQGGSLRVESQPGQGSCFFFDLPMARMVLERTPEETEHLNPKLEAPQILVIEDNLTAAQLIKSQLTSAGYHAVVCEEPQSAVEMAAKLQPHAITLDMLMKPINGFEVLLNLKNDPRTAAIPVIVVTIVDHPGMGTTLGADEYLVKPVKKETLLSSVQRCLQARGVCLPTRPILVVEDDKATREIIAELLASNGYSVATAADGIAARTRMAESLPELVILDLLLPEVSGFELLAEWRADPRTAEMPVFVLTGKDLNEVEEKYLQNHAEFILRKQAHWQQGLLEQLQRVKGRRELEKS